MKKKLLLSLSLLLVLTLTGCKEDTFKISVIIPAGTTEGFSYSDEIIHPKKNTLKISGAEGLTAAEVILLPVKVEEENIYEPFTLKHNEPVKIDVEKDGWYKVGVNIINDSDTDIVVSIEVSDVVVSIE